MILDSSLVILLIGTLVVVTCAQIIYTYVKFRKLDDVNASTFNKTDRTTKTDSESNNLSTNAPSTNTQKPESPVYRDIYQHGPAMFLIMDSRRTIHHINPALAKLLDSSPKQTIGKRLEDIVISGDHCLIQDLNAQSIRLQDDEYCFDLRLAVQGKDTLWVKIHPKHLNKNINSDRILLFIQDIRESKSFEELLAFRAKYDELTLLHNRSALEQYLEDQLQNVKTNKAPTNSSHAIAIIYINIDQLKVVNDTCGHAAGDALLQQMVGVISEVSEQCDFFARVDSDEFALIKMPCTENEAIDIAEHVRSAAEDFTFIWQDHLYRQSISVGVAISSEDINTVIDLLGAADAACSTAKSKGKNRVSSYSKSSEPSQDKRKDMMWVSRLQKAIQDSAFELYFHPIIQLSPTPNSHVHYELLIRYVDENGTHIEPQHFLPAVERFGLSEQVDLWVLTTALDFLHKHPEHTEILNCCSINLTTQSISNPRIRSAMLQVVESYDFPKEKICFEITESSAIHNLGEAQNFVKELKSLGCNLALDDFGTGFSSFGYLKHLEVDYIKIDGCFVNDIITDKFDRAMVSAINNMGKQMGIPIIAEYASSAKILSALRDMEIDYAQGYAISRPMPIYKLEDYYDSISTKNM